MSTVVIDIPNQPQKRYEIDLAGEADAFVHEVEKLVTKFAPSSKSAKNGSKRLTPKLREARNYLKSISRRAESKAALAEADEIRKSWIRKNA